MAQFPIDHNDDQIMEFHPSPFKTDAPFAVISFVWQNESVLLSHITNRGWCVPSGRIEQNETQCAAAMRETFEEAAAHIKNPIAIGTFKITDKSTTKYAVATTSLLDSLDPFVPNSESTERILCPISKLPEIYYLWTPLTEAVFIHSLKMIRSSD